MAKIRTGDIQVEGLRELNRALRDLGGKPLQAELSKAGKESADVVVSSARGIAGGVGGVAAKLADVIAAKGYTTGAAVSLSSQPWAAGAEFGGGRRPTTRQFKPWRGSGPGAGYVVYESIRHNADKVRDLYENRLYELAERLDLT